MTEPIPSSRPESRMYGWSNVSVTIGGRKYTGNFVVRGTLVEVASAYGSRTVDAKGRDAKTEAEEVLRDLAANSRH